MGTLTSADVLTGADVWTAILEDPAFTETVEWRVQDAIRPLIEAAPSALAGFLDRQLTLRVLLDAKIAFLRYCLENGLADIMAQLLGIDDASMITKLLGVVIEMLAAEAEYALPDILSDFMEERVMLSPQVGLSNANKLLWRTGKLTVAEVLRTQPAVILKNGE